MPITDVLEKKPSELESVTVAQFDCDQKSVADPPTFTELLGALVRKLLNVHGILFAIGVPPAVSNPLLMMSWFPGPVVSALVCGVKNIDVIIKSERIPRKTFLNERIFFFMIINFNFVNSIYCILFL